MQEQFVTYEIAKKLKESGFDEPCFGFFTSSGELMKHSDHEKEHYKFHTLRNSDITVSNYLAAPLWQQAIDFFRTGYDIFVQQNIQPGTHSTKDVHEDTEFSVVVVQDGNTLDGGIHPRYKGMSHKTYHDARKLAVEEAFKCIQTVER